MDYAEAIGCVVVEELKTSVETFFDRGEIHNDEKNTLRSLLEVISYYSVKDEYEAFFRMNKRQIETALGVDESVGPNTLTIEMISENPDGSANVDVTMGSEIKNTVMSEGVNFLLMKGVLNGTTDEVLRWAQRGKQEENTDSIMERYHAARADAEERDF